MRDFEDWLAITETKARYCRFLDTKAWEDWGDLFTPDFVLDTREAGGTITHDRGSAVEMVRQAIDPARTAHQVHTPEITIDGDAARAIWAMQDRVQFADHTGFVGYGHYHETYRRQDGRWLIATSKLTRLHIDPIA